MTFKLLILSVRLVGIKMVLAPFESNDTMTTVKHDKEYDLVTSGTASKPSNIAMATAVSTMNCDSSKEPQDASSPRQGSNTDASTGTARGTQNELSII
jgi:hypothetical protein